MTTDPPRVVLVGFMGTGKTTVGRSLAELLSWEFLDLDRRVEERVGHSVEEIFATQGEAAFRREERAAALEAAGRRHTVIAAGGGAFASAETREALRQGGAATVWLRCNLPTLLERIPFDGSRPLATNRARIERLLAEREPAYRLADLTVDTNDAVPTDVARAIIKGIFGRESQARAGGNERP